MESVQGCGSVWGDEEGTERMWPTRAGTNVISGGHNGS